MNFKSISSLLFFDITKSHWYCKHQCDLVTISRLLFTVTIHVIDLKFSVCVLNIPLEGSVSQIFYLGPSFYFMSKIG